MPTSKDPGMHPNAKDITFSIKPHLEAILCVWSWRHRVSVPANDEHVNASSIMKEGHKYGLRTITKAHWDMLDEMACTETEMHHPNQGTPNHEPSEPTACPRLDCHTGCDNGSGKGCSNQCPHFKL